MKRRIKAIRCDVYSRVVGYYRPVSDWNNGKREEFELRETVGVDVFDAEADPG